jgi:hypothetical protein
LWVLSRVAAFQLFHESDSHFFPQFSQSILVENLQSYHLNLCFRWQIFRRSFGTTRDMLTLMPCIGRVFHVSCGSHFNCLATPSHHNMMEWSIVKRVFLGAEWRWLFPSIHLDPCGSPSRLMLLVTV